MNTAQAKQAMQSLLNSEAGSTAQKQQLLALTDAPVTADVLVGAAQALHDVMLPFPRPTFPIMDVVGTGGDGLNTYNISTATSLVLAAAGFPIAKHGNHASTSASGAADVLHALGIDIHAAPEKMAACLHAYHWAFLLAPAYHPQLGRLAATRKALGKRSIINLLGPLCNPAKPDWLLLGVPTPALLTPMAEALQRLGHTRAWVVCGADGMDELSLSGVNQIRELSESQIRHFTLAPVSNPPLVGGSQSVAMRGGGIMLQDLSPPRNTSCFDPPTRGGLEIVHPLPYRNISELQAPAGADYAAALIHVLQGQPSAYADAVCLNAAAGLVLAGKAADIHAGCAQARAVLQSGATYELLQKIKCDVGQAE